MKCINKIIIAVFALLGLGGNLLGFDWIINNKTDKPIIVELMLEKADWTKYRLLIEPNKSKTFPLWKENAGVCWWRWRVTEYDKNDAQRFAAENPGTAEEKAFLANMKLDQFFVSNPLMERYLGDLIWDVPTILYPKSNIDAAKIVNVVKSFGKPLEAAAGAAAGVPLPELGLGELLGSVTDLIIYGYTQGACASRTYDVYEMNPSAQKRTVIKDPKVIQLKNLKAEMRGLIGGKDEVPNAIALVEKNKDLLGAETFTNVMKELKTPSQRFESVYNEKERGFQKRRISDEIDRAVKPLNVLIAKVQASSTTTGQPSVTDSRDPHYIFINRVNQ